MATKDDVNTENKNTGLEAVDEFAIETTKLPKNFDDVNVLFNVSNDI